MFLNSSNINLQASFQVASLGKIPGNAHDQRIHRSTVAEHFPRSKYTTVDEIAYIYKIVINNA
jgi:hypothetical protein